MLVLATAAAVVAVAPALLHGQQPPPASRTPTARVALGAPAAPRPMVFDRVTVIDVAQGTLLPAQRVVVTGTRIAALGPAAAVPVPPGAQVVDGRGKYLIPGLWNMHLHAPLPEQLGDFYRLLVFNGITGFRSAGDRSSLDTLRAWQRAILAGTRVGPVRQLFSGRMLGVEQHGSQGLRLRDIPLAPNNEHDCGDPDARLTRMAHFCLKDTADARHAIDSEVVAGVDMIKIWGVSKPMYAFIAAEARRLGKPFGGHAGGHGDLPPDEHAYLSRMGVLEASDLGARFIDHDLGEPSCEVHPADLAQCQAQAQRYRRNDTWFVPTLVYRATDIGGAGEDAGAGEATKALTEGFTDAFGQTFGRFLTGKRQPVSNWLHPLDSVRAALPPPRDSLLSVAERTGLPLLAGTNLPGDAPADAFGLHVELASLVAEGLSPLHALQSATLNPAQAWHATDSLGTVAPGKLADLVLLDANPLADITNTTTIRAVVANGRYYDRAALDQLLAEVRATATPNP